MRELQIHRMTLGLIVAGLCSFSWAARGGEAVRKDGVVVSYTGVSETYAGAT